MLQLPRIQAASSTAKEKLREKKRRAKQDPYRAAQAAQRRAANLQRQEVLRAQEAKAFGDPVKGVTTPFLESLDTIGKSSLASKSSTPSWASSQSGDGADAGNVTSADAADATTSSQAGSDSSSEASSSSQPDQQSPTGQYLNHHVTPAELADALAEAEFFTRPYPTNDPEKTRQALAQHEKDHAKASKILRRLLSLENGSTRDHLTANIARCVEKFGRHNTDNFLRQRAKGPRPLGPDGKEIEVPEPAPRAGPDTGSSEVQIAVLTAKIRRLAQRLQGHRQFHDKANKRTLRLLVHKRQRLLKYMERKERGSERWTYMLRELGLTPATWKGQITL